MITAIKQNRRKVFCLLCLLTTGFLFYVLNMNTPLYADDYSYAFSFLDRSRIENFKDILVSQYGHYFNMNGRFVTHTIAQLFLLWGKDVFNVVNVFGFLALGLLIYYHAIGTYKDLKASLLSFIYCLMFLCTPAFGQSYLWIDGSATYLYGVIIALIYLIPYRNIMTAVKNGTYIPDRPWISAVKFLVMLAGGILAGNTLENMSAAIVLIITGYLIWYYLNKVKLQCWMLGLGNLLGMLLLLVSPGTGKRLDSTGSLTISGIFKNVLFIGVDFLEYYQLPILICAVLLVFLLVGKSTRRIDIGIVRNYVSTLMPTLIYTVGTLAAAFSMILSPSFPPRAWSCVTVLLIISLISFVHVLRDKLVGLCKCKAVMLVCILLISFATYFNAYFDLRITYASNAQRAAYIQECADEGVSEVYVPAITSQSPYSVFMLTPDLNWDWDTWPNADIAKYYDVDKIIRLE